MVAKGDQFEIIEDIGSGINYGKKGLSELIKRINNDEVERVVVMFKDRLVRFGFELIDQICKLHNVEIEIIDNTEQPELVEDLIQIVTVCSCRLQGKRANKAKKMIKELTSSDNSEES